MADLAHYEQLLYEKRREAKQATLDAFFSRVSFPEASASDEPHTSKEPPTSNEPPASEEPPTSEEPQPPTSKEPQPSTSTGRFTHTNVLSPSSSDIDDLGVI